jgi:hypothetical protein
MSIHWRHRSKNAPVNLARLRVTKVRRFQEPRTADFGKSMVSWVRSENRTHDLRGERRLLSRLSHRSPYKESWMYRYWLMNEDKLDFFSNLDSRRLYVVDQRECRLGCPSHRTSQTDRCCKLNTAWFCFTEFLTHWWAVFQTGYCPIDRRSEVPTILTSLSEKTRKSNHLRMSV